MARRVPGRPGGKPWSFIPTAFGNAHEPTPITIVINNPTEARKRELFVAVEAEVARLVADGMSRAHASAVAWLSIPVLQCVVRVESYDNAAGEPITTAAELLEHGEIEVVTEVCNAIIGKHQLSDAEKKSSVSPSSSSSPETTPSPGTAVTAEPSATPPPAAAA